MLDSTDIRFDPAPTLPLAQGSARSGARAAAGSGALETVRQWLDANGMVRQGKVAISNFLTIQPGRVMRMRSRAHVWSVRLNRQKVGNGRYRRWINAVSSNRWLTVPNRDFLGGGYG